MSLEINTSYGGSNGYLHCPGVPSCSITCANGCYAIYFHPTQKCVTGCNDNPPAVIAAGDRFSIQISEMNPGDVAKLFGRYLPDDMGPKLTASKKAINVSMKDTTLADLADAIRNAM